MRRDPTPAEVAYRTETKLYQSDLGGLWCSLFAQAYSEDWDSIRFAMASTGIYLTINLGYSLSALPHIDAVWDPKRYPKYEDRVSRLRDFRPTYDAFDAFLGKSVSVVAESLSEGGLVRCKAFEQAAVLSEYLPVFDKVFAMVRGRTFDIALGIAERTPRGSHPLVQPVTSADGEVKYAIRTDLIHANVLQRDAVLEGRLEQLINLGQHIRRVFGTGVFGLFGGLKFSDVRKLKEQGYFSNGQSPSCIP